MKRTLITLAAVLAVGAPGAAVAADTTPAELWERIDQLTMKLERTQDRVEHKAEVLACERANRRELARALRTGKPVGVLAVCR